MDNIQSFTEKLPNNIDLEMIAIPAGSFMMGSDENESEQPIHKVTFAEGFFMGKYPITQAQYEAVMGKNPSKFKGENNPIENVSWNDAQRFCENLSEITGRKYQLPSEAQWEYACRAGSTGKWCFGDDENQLKDYAWYRHSKFICLTYSVGKKKPNQLGLYDMHGNVWEYCEDDWHNNYQNAPDDGNAWINKSRKCVVMRGGSRNNYSYICRSANRHFSKHELYNIGYGFRVVMLDIIITSNSTNPPNAERTQTTKTIKIFLASSSELESDRDQFEIFIGRENKNYIKEGIFLELVMWEDFIDAMSQTRLQDEYNKAISECDIFVSLFFTKVGKYTEEEFLKALETFKANNKPKIYTYFKDANISLNDITIEQFKSLDNFKKKLSDLGHFFTQYSDINDLKYQFSQQLTKILPEIKKNYK